LFQSFYERKEGEVLEEEEKRDEDYLIYLDEDGGKARKGLNGTPDMKNKKDLMISSLVCQETTPNEEERV
jgi:hypothetical protein